LGITVPFYLRFVGYYQGFNMANKQKAWRTNAAKINARRAAGGREPTARVQKAGAFKILGSPSFLFMGLMMRAGLYDPMPLETTTGRRPSANPNLGATYGKDKPWYTKAWDKAKSFFK
jgi:hypothetical protein